MLNLYTIIVVFTIIQCIQLVRLCITYSQLSIVIHCIILRQQFCNIIYRLQESCQPSFLLFGWSGPIQANFRLVQWWAYWSVTRPCQYFILRLIGSFWYASVRYSDKLGAWRIVPVFP